MCAVIVLTLRAVEHRFLDPKSKYNWYVGVRTRLEVSGKVLGVNTNCPLN